MKKGLLAGAALALLPTPAHAQGATAPVTVTVQSDATLTRSGSTSFGTIGTTGRTVTINPRSPALDQSVAVFTAQGAPNANVVVTFDPGVTLCHQTSECASASIPFTAEVSASDCGPHESSFCQANSATITTDTVVRLSPAGFFYFFLGGSLTPATNQAPGAYEGTFSMRVVYQ